MSEAKSFTYRKIINMINCWKNADGNPSLSPSKERDLCDRCSHKRVLSVALCHLCDHGSREEEAEKSINIYTQDCCFMSSIQQLQVVAVLGGIQIFVQWLVCTV